MPYEAFANYLIRIRFVGKKWELVGYFATRPEVKLLFKILCQIVHSQGMFMKINNELWQILKTTLQKQTLIYTYALTSNRLYRHHKKTVILWNY